MKRCYSCQKDLPLKEAPGIEATCQYCGMPLRCCFNCRHYSPDTFQQCLIPTVQLLKNKKNANECDKFLFREIFSQRSDAPQEESKKRLNDLFRNL